MVDKREIIMEFWIIKVEPKAQMFDVGNFKSATYYTTLGFSLT